jgi:lipopolysaccharide/colanic/teichoic acid biosynthesis glycosyltransferase
MEIMNRLELRKGTRSTTDTLPDARRAPAESVEAWLGLRANPAYERAKRALDVTVACLSLLLLAPVLVGIALLIKLTSRGPVFYRGTVIGRYGRPFTYYKFRTMRVDGDDGAHRRFIERYMRGSGETKLREDPRITPVGRWIRRTSLDEMAQMFNVLRGQMSIVGPPARVL